MNATPHPSDVRLIDLTAADAERVLEIEEAVWFTTHVGLSAERLTETLEWERTRAFEYVGTPRVGRPAAAPAPLVGLYSDWPMAVTAPGPLGSTTRLPMGGLTWVAVDPNHRRQGLLTAMIRDHLARLRAEGTVISGLHASEPGIYGRFGYGMSSLDVEYSLGRGTTFRAPEPVVAAAKEVTTHVVTAEGAAEAIHAAHLALAPHRLGTVTRSDHLATTMFLDWDTVRGEKEPVRVLFAQRDDEVVGYAIFRRISKWDDNLPNGEVRIPEIAALDNAALLAIGQRLVDFDLTGKVQVFASGLDDPLLWWAGGPRAVGMKASDSLWLRLIDVQAALEQRGYASPCDVVLDVVDDLCDWNAGSWRLTVDEIGAATCARTDADAQVRLPVAALGAAYLGGRSLASQALTGDVVELVPGALGDLSRSLRADTDPMGAIGF